MALELTDTNNVTITSYFDTAGGLRLRCGTTELASYGDHVLVRTDATAIVFTVSGPDGLSSTVTHEDDEGATVVWAGGCYTFVQPTSDPLEVTLATVSAASGSTGDMKKIKIEAKPGGALPDRP